MSDYTKLPKIVAETMEKAGLPLTEDQYILLTGSLALHQKHMEKLEARIEGLKLAIEFTKQFYKERGIAYCLIDPINKSER